MIICSIVSEKKNKNAMNLMITKGILWLKNELQVPEEKSRAQMIVWIRNKFPNAPVFHSRRQRLIF